METKTNFRKLNEEYHIMTPCGLVTCEGRKIADDFAIVRNWKDGSFSVTHIPSGLAVQKCSSLLETKDRAEELVKRGMDFILSHEEMIQSAIENFNSCLERKIFCNYVTE